MSPYHICLHARPPHVTEGDVVVIAGYEVAALAIRPESCGAPFGVSFEEAAEALATLPRMFVEPDGSFVWVGGSADSRWQIDGSLYDRDGRLLYVELKGCCPLAELELLWRAFGWPEQPLVVQLVQQAVFVEEPEFRRLIRPASPRG